MLLADDLKTSTNHGSFLESVVVRALQNQRFYEISVASITFEESKYFVVPRPLDFKRHMNRPPFLYATYIVYIWKGGLYRLRYSLRL